MQRIRRDVQVPRGVNDLLISAEGWASRVHNLVLTPYGSLRAVVLPTEYVRTRPNDQQGPTAPVWEYENIRGLHHSVVEGGRRDVLLAHFGDNVWELRGWTRFPGGGPGSEGWVEVLTPQGGGAGTGEARPTLGWEGPGRAGDFLTQFISTPDGVVIVPQGGRAHFYDGSFCLPLGYDRAPGPPVGLGPHGAGYAEGEGSVWTDTQGGYYKSGREVSPAYGPNRLGTVRGDVVDPSSDANPLGGVLEPGVWRAAVQFVDRWGNLSPVGQQSTPIVVRKEDNLTQNRKRDGEETVERLRIQVAWSGIDRGPQGTVGRILLRTRDLQNAGIPGLFEVPADSTGTTVAYATIPDNETDLFPDNVPDQWLNVPAQDVVPVPNFRVGIEAFGCLWVGNWDGGRGTVRYSMPGRWGTFLRNDVLVPDPRGWEVTGFLLTSQGLLIFTEMSTHLVTPGDDGEGFRVFTLSQVAGCVSPNTAKVLPSGLAVWLGREGWYVLDEEGIRLASTFIDESIVRRINPTYWRKACAVVCPSTREYRCWVPFDGQRETLCVVFDGDSWRTRDELDARAACTTEDHRGLVLVLGESRYPEAKTSLWVQDHGVTPTGNSPDMPPVVLETVWLRAAESADAGTQLSTVLWVRETSERSKPRITHMRDWRVHPPAHVEEDNPPNLIPTEDPPLMWGSVRVDDRYRPDARPRDKRSIPTHWTRRRPYWIRVDTQLPMTTFKVRLEVEGDVDFVAYYTEQAVTASPGVRPASRR